MHITCVPQLTDVPGFWGIFIHEGNTVDDTRGCILLHQQGLPEPLKAARHCPDRRDTGLRRKAGNGVGDGK